MIFLNVLLGTLVVAVGLWLLWGSAVPIILVASTLIVGSFLLWKARTMTEIWAWSTLFLGLESVAWPFMLMAQLKSASAPSEEEMGTMLSAVVLGLFSSVFWISFSYGLFKRAWGTATSSPTTASPAQPESRPVKRNKAR